MTQTVAGHSGSALLLARRVCSESDSAPCHHYITYRESSWTKRSSTVRIPRGAASSSSSQTRERQQRRRRICTTFFKERLWVLNSKRIVGRRDGCEQDGNGGEAEVCVGVAPSGGRTDSGAIPTQKTDSSSCLAMLATFETHGSVFTGV